jgi:hypothetical protein
MAYKIATLRKALDKLNKIRPDLSNEDCYPWDDGKIYIYDPRIRQDKEIIKLIGDHFK